MPKPPPAKSAPVWPLFVLVAMTLLAYIPAFSGGWVWDDDDYVTQNLTLRTASGLRDIWVHPLSIPQYYPLTHTTFWIEYQLAGLTPAVFHTTNILLHLCSVLLFYRLLRRLKLPGAWFAAALFAIHPIGVESVAWVAERKNVLSMVFYLSSALIWVRFFQLDEPLSEQRPKWKQSLSLPMDRGGLYALGMVCFIAALLSKSVTSTLPAAMLLLIWWKRGRLTRQAIWPMLPLFVLSAIMGATTGWIERNHVGAIGPEWPFSPVQRLLLAGGDVWFYVSKILWPHPLVLVYHKWSIDPRSLVPWIAPVAAAAVLVTLWTLRGRIGRGPITAALLFVGGLFPALGFVNIYPMKFTYVQDHFSYHASLALFAAAGVIAVSVRQRVGTAASAGVGALVLLTLGVLTYQQSKLYADALPLYAHAMKFTPESPMPPLDYGKTLMLRHQQPETAEAMLRTGAAMLPGRSEPWDLLGMLFESYQKWNDAKAAYEMERQLAPTDPRSIYRLGHIASMQHHPVEAEADFREAILLQPDYEAANIELGNLALSKNNPADAAAYYATVLKASPYSELAVCGMARADMAMNQPAAAEEMAKQAIALEPRDPIPWNLLGVIRANRGDMNGARDALEQLVALRPDIAEAHFDLSLVLAKLGDASGAIRERETAQQLRATRVQASPATAATQ